MESARMWWSCLHTPCAARVAGDASDAGSEADERPLRQGREEDPLAGHACSPYDCAAADRQQPHASSSGRQAGAPVAERAAYGALSRLAGRTAGPAVDGQHGCSPTSVLSVGSTESPAQRRSLLQRTRPSPRGGSSAPPRRRQDREGGAASRAPGPTGRSQRSGPNQVEVSERALLAACAQGAWDGAVRLLDAGVDVDAATTVRPLQGSCCAEHATPTPRIATGGAGARAGCAKTRAQSVCTLKLGTLRDSEPPGRTAQLLA
eukprot:358287-Chlamydomonas_euryale.AAC.8